MPKRRSYLPTRDKDFYEFQKILADSCTTNKVAWGIEDAALTVVTDEKAIYEPLYAKIVNKSTRSKGDVLAHREEKEKYAKIIMTFINAQIRYNDKMTDKNRSDVGVPPRDTSLSPHPPIDDIPLVGARAQGGGDLEFRVRVTEDKTMASMHPAANLIEFRFTILEPGDIPPTDENDYPKKEVSSRAKFTLALGLKNTGKKFFGIFRWVNTHKPRTVGHWTEPISVIIA